MGIVSSISLLEADGGCNQGSVMGICCFFYRCRSCVSRGYVGVWCVVFFLGEEEGEREGRNLVERRQRRVPALGGREVPAANLRNFAN